MRFTSRFSWFMATGLLLAAMSAAHASDTTVIAEAQYTMADGDTLAAAEEKVFQRAQRRAVEEAGVYLEATFRDVEKSAGGISTQTSSLEIRTLAAAITKTEILELHRSFENNRPTFSIRIRAVVNLDNLQEAIRRWHSEEQFAEHFRQLQKENAALKAQLHDLQKTPVGVRTLVIEPPGRTGAKEQARALVDSALQTHDLRQKLDLTSQAAALDAQYADPLIVRGQTYLRLVSLAYSSKSKPSDYSSYIDDARMDFDRALMINPKNAWAWLGQGDVHTWLKHPEEAARAYEQALELNPFFDIARQRLIALYTMEARKQVAAKQWTAALTTLKKLLGPQVPDSWLPYQKEAYLLRSEIHQKLNQPTDAIADLSVVLQTDPTNTQALLARARLYREQLHGRLAKDDFERACVLGVSDACDQLP